MRSDLVFSASRSVHNRFHLCRMLFAGAVRLHSTGKDYSETINRALTLLGSSTVEQDWLAIDRKDQSSLEPGAPALPAAADAGR